MSGDSNCSPPLDLGESQVDPISLLDIAGQENEEDDDDDTEDMADEEEEEGTSVFTVSVHACMFCLLIVR